MTYIDVYNVSYNLIYVFVGTVFFKSFLTQNKLNRGYRYLITLSWLFLVNVISFWGNSFIAIKLILAIFANAIYIFFSYERQNKMPIVALALGGMHQALAVGCDAVSIAIQKIYMPNLSYSILVENTFLILLGIISQLIHIIIVFLIHVAFNKNNGNVVPWKAWLSYSVFPMYSIGMITTILFAFDGQCNEKQTLSFLYIAISLLLLNIIIYYVINSEINRRLFLQKNEILISHAKEVVGLYESISEERNELGKREHEYKNTINALAKLYSSGEMKKLGELLSVYSKQCMDSNVFETGNPIMSTLFNIKYAEAQRYGIRFQFLINDLSTLKIEDQDAIILVSNILNNAIEASMKCESKNRYIKVKAIIENRQFIFSVVNSKANDLVVENEEILSSKQDTVKHGYGIKRMIEIIEAYNGIYDIDFTDVEFQISIIIPQ